MGKLRKRMSFSRIEEILDMPDLIEVQKNSYRRFLEVDLKEVLDDVSPIVDYTENLSLEFVDYSLDEPKNSVERCKERDMTYAAPLKATGADPDREPPYAPPLLASASQGVPDEAVLWRVVVTSGGSKGNTYEILPQLATAAAQAVGKNMQADVFVDSDMRVTFGK